MINKLNINQDIASSIHFHQVYTWAKGAIPKSLELQALAYLKYKDSNRWLDVYIPSNKIALYILNDCSSKLLSQAFKNQKKLYSEFTNLDCNQITKIIENPRESVIHKATIFAYLAWKHYLSYLSKTTNTKTVLQFLEINKTEIQNFITKMINDINPSSTFGNQLTQTIRENLTLNDFENGLVTNKIKKLLLPYLFKLFE